MAWKKIICLFIKICKKTVQIIFVYHVILWAHINSNPLKLSHLGNEKSDGTVDSAYNIHGYKIQSVIVCTSIKRQS